MVTRWPQYERLALKLISFGRHPSAVVSRAALQRTRHDPSAAHMLATAFAERELSEAQEELDTHDDLSILIVRLNLLLAAYAPLAPRWSPGIYTTYAELEDFYTVFGWFGVLDHQVMVVENPGMSATLAAGLTLISRHQAHGTESGLELSAPSDSSTRSLIEAVKRVESARCQLGRYGQRLSPTLQAPTE
jgi:hypothetical protein